MSARTAFLFPGQGDESAGMAAAYVARSGPVRTLLDRASARVGVDLGDIIARGSPLLARTELIQPALCAISLGLAAQLQALGESADAVAGHSLGELAAASVAGCITAEQAVDLACARGAQMGAAALRAPGGMVALRAARREIVDEAVAHGTLEVAAHNAPDLWILSGSAEALAELAAHHKVTRLPVSGPWHSRSMTEAQAGWLAELRAVAFAPPRRAWFANRAGEQVGPEDDVPGLLAGQLTKPVQWTQTMAALQHAGIERFIIVGPTRTLRGLCRANLGQRVRVLCASGTRPLEEERAR